MVSWRGENKKMVSAGQKQEMIWWLQRDLVEHGEGTIMKAPKCAALNRADLEY
jgi:hypothetical protein